jgi:aspartate/methionine/tyrosine aminotransferase
MLARRMSRPRLEHLAWSKAQQGRWPLSLADSAVATPDLEVLGLPHRAGTPAVARVLPELERALGVRLGAPGARVLVTAGASEANACALAGLLEPGEEALVESPGYEPHRAVPPYFGVSVRTFARRREHGYGRVSEAVETALTPVTRLVLLTDLHNPGGVPLEPADAASLTALAERRGLWLVCDETFRDAAERPVGTSSTLSDRWVTTSTLTKAYGLGSLRVGWVSGSTTVLARCAEAQNALSVEPAGPSLALALALVPHLDSLRARARGILSANHALWRSMVASGLQCDASVPSQGTTAFVHLPEPAGGDAFAVFAAERFELQVVPGRFFGEPRGVRIGLGGEPSRCAAALDTFQTAIRAFREARRTAAESP